MQASAQNANPITIHWFRQDLRLEDNPALIDAAGHVQGPRQGHVLPIYILDDQNSGEFAMGAASRCWLHHSLAALSKSLNGHLSLYRGDPIEILLSLTKRFNVSKVTWTRCYEPWQTERDAKIKAKLQTMGLTAASHNGSLLWEPWSINKDDGTPYKVFTPFYHKGCMTLEPPRDPLAVPQLHTIQDEDASLPLSALKLLPKTHWHHALAAHWPIGEQGAQNQFQDFISQGLADYKEGRNLPSKPFVSRLSPRLHFGELSPNQLWHGVREVRNDQNVDHFCSELGWREFSYSQLYHNPDLPHAPLQSKFERFPWVKDESALRAWQHGQTGIPMVDAGMRELWQTGYMHNRVRMIVGSFLVKNLRLHWRCGERWFWDTLVDADLANNSASWQWIAGCGADAAPYFRIFNPVSQGQKFDPNGDYVRKFLPELSHLPNAHLFAPWEAPASVLKAANIQLGDTYPAPIVNLQASREAALKAFQSLKLRD